MQYTIEAAGLVPWRRITDALLAPPNRDLRLRPHQQAYGLEPTSRPGEGVGRQLAIEIFGFGEERRWPA
jgi:hypothetical protein